MLAKSRKNIYQILEDATIAKNMNTKKKLLQES